MSESVEDDLCREWLNKAIEKVGDAADKRNIIIHSEYFADLSNLADSHLLQNKPPTKTPKVRRPGIDTQLTQAIKALEDARFYMEFAFSATRGREYLEQTLALYEPALRERRERQQTRNPPQGSR